ncbi:hypothetical protein CsakCS09_18935 [Cronobacter sakazakii]|nr:hypothetical protein CsakCS09_18935 [Cronobacter sakazakii]
MNIVLMLSNFNLNITLLVQADLVNGSNEVQSIDRGTLPKEGANKRGNSSRLTQSFHFFMFEPIFSPVNALNQPI